jgi:hypothetical protein
MNKRELLEVTKSRFGVIEDISSTTSGWVSGKAAFTYLQEDGSTIGLSAGDIENIRRFAEFKETRDFLLWYKYKMRGN